MVGEVELLDEVPEVGRGDVQGLGTHVDQGAGHGRAAELATESAARLQEADVVAERVEPTGSDQAGDAAAHDRDGPGGGHGL